MRVGIISFARVWGPVLMQWACLGFSLETPHSPLPTFLHPSHHQYVTVRNERGAALLKLIEERVERRPPVSAGDRKALVLQTVLADDECVCVRGGSRYCCQCPWACTCRDAYFLSAFLTCLAAGPQ